MADFTQHPEAVNGASDLMTGIFGEAGRHAHAVRGGALLPRRGAVGIEIYEIA
jgi:hypothetical protein